MTPPPLPRETSGLAIASLVTGILGWTFLLGAGGLIAIITGHMARAELRRDPARKGHGFAIAGLVLGYVATLLITGWFVWVILQFAGF